MKIEVKYLPSETKVFVRRLSLEQRFYDELFSDEPNWGEVLIIRKEDRAWIAQNQKPF